MKLKIGGQRIPTQQTKLKQTKSMTLVITSVACIVIVFCLVATKTLLSEAGHQRRVLNSRHAAINQLKANIAAVNALNNQLQAINSQSANIIGGASSGTGANDGSNEQIILDALPNQYDFPGLTASVEKLVSARGITLDSISGTDNESANISHAIPDPKPVVMAFSFSATTNFKTTSRVFADFQNSIRPFHVTSLQLSGTDSKLTIVANINAYYQPSKSLSVTSTEVK